MSIWSDLKNSCLAAGMGDEPDILKAEFCLPSNLPVFRGHFPGFPLVPGVMQVEMVAVALTKITGKTYCVTGLKKAKFMEIVRPGEHLALTMKREERQNTVRVKAELRVAGRSVSSLSVDLRVC